MLTDEASADLSAAFAGLVARLRRPDVDAKLADELLGSTYVLCGLRHDEARVADLYRSLGMLLEDSTTYQGLLRKGTAQGATQAAQRLLRIMARKQFGASTTAEATLQGIADSSRLERMAERIFDATGWDDLLATA